MFDVPMYSTNCRTPRSRTPRPSQTFLEDNSTNSKNTMYSPFEIKSESDFDEYDQMLSENSFPTNSKSGVNENVQATHSSSYTNTSISRPIMIQEPVINNNSPRSFFQPPILAQSPKSNNFLNNQESGDFEFYPDEDEFYPTDSFVANAKNNAGGLFCFSDDDDDFDKRNGIDIKKPGFIKEISSENENSKSESKPNYIVNRKDGINLNNSFDEFDLKCKNSSEVNNNSVKLINSKIFNFEFEDSADDSNNSSNKNKNASVGLSTKFGQTRLLKFDDQSNYPVSLEPTSIDSLNNDQEKSANKRERENDNSSPWNEIPRPFLPASVSPSNFLLEFQKHEAEENLKKARIEWDERIEKQKEISRAKFAELHEKQKMESAPFGSRKSNKNSTSPQRLELISKSSGLEQPVFRVRTVPAVNITKAISDYDKFSKANNLNNEPTNFECNNDYDYTNNYDNKNDDIYSPPNPKPRSAIPSTNSISSPRTIQTPRPIPKTPNPASPSKDPKRKTIFKATSDIPGMAAYKKRTNATLIPTTTTTTNTNTNNNYSYMSMMSNADMKREKKLLEDRHKQEVLALNAECTASIKALEDKKNADIAMKENQLRSIVEKIELQRRRDEIENRLKNQNNDFDIKIKNKNSATPDNFKQGRIEFNVTGRLKRKQQTIDDLQKQMMPYSDKD